MPRKDDPPLGGDWRGFQSDIPRIAVEGLHAHHTPRGWVLGETRTVQLVRHRGGWLVLLYGREEHGEQAAWITTEDGAVIADFLGGTHA